MKKHSILIIAGNEYYKDVFTRFSQRSQLFSRIDTATDGQEGLEKIIRLEPDLIITSLVLEKIDAIGLIEGINSSPELKRPRIIVSSCVTHPDIIDLALNKGADLYFTSGITFDQFYEKISSLLSQPAKVVPKSRHTMPNTTLMSLITKEIQLIGLPPSSMGFKYVRYAIMLVIEDESMLECVMMRLYPQIADKFNTNPAFVERNIRHSIESAWTHVSISYIDEVFGYSIDADKGKPTNRAFIATVADKIRLDNRL